MDPRDDDQQHRPRLGANVDQSSCTDSSRCCSSSSSRAAAAGGAAFPPPLTILTGNRCYSRFPHCMPRGSLRPIRKNGRLLLVQEVSAPRQLLFRSVRKDGRLVMLLQIEEDDRATAAVKEVAIDQPPSPESESELEPSSSESSSPWFSSRSSSSSSSLSLSSGSSVCCDDGESDSKAAPMTDSVIKDGGRAIYQYGNRLQKLPASAPLKRSNSSLDDFVVGNFCGKSQWKKYGSLDNIQSISHWTH